MVTSASDDLERDMPDQAIKYCMYEALHLEGRFYCTKRKGHGGSHVPNLNRPVPQPIEVGDWVQVWGLVKKTDGPGDMLIRFESHGEHYEGWIRNEHITQAETPPMFAGRCVHLIGDLKGRLRRCDLHHEHGGRHQEHRKGGSLRTEWSSSESVGYIEEA